MTYWALNAVFLAAVVVLVVAAVLARHPDVRKARLVVEGKLANDRMKLVCERAAAPAGAAGSAGDTGDEAALGKALSTSVRDVTKLRVDAVEWVDAGSLPNDGKVIDDQRDYD